MLERFRSAPDDVVSFRCLPEMAEAAPDPVPAQSALPEWFTDLPVDPKEGLSSPTAKACLPLLDAMKAGWIIPLPVDVHIQADEAGQSVSFNYNTEFDAITHDFAAYQTGDLDAGPIVKFQQPWVVRTPTGWSCLFVQPLNRPESRYRLFSGLVDTDRYDLPVNFPAYWTEPGFDGVLERGTPLVQVIPYRRDRPSEAEVRPMTDDEAERESAITERVAAATGYYRDDVWVAKRG